MTHELLATCWTSAGDAQPVTAERSPLSVEERVRALAEGGWSGIGLNMPDLRVARDTVGLDGLAALIDDSGLRHLELELVVGWWEPGGAAVEDASARDLLLEAAASLGALHVKVGPPVGTGPTAWPDLVAPLRGLTRRAADHGVRLALEPLPFSTVRTVPLGARLVAEVGEPNLGLCVDAWHVFRAGTALDELNAGLWPGLVLGVELDDADAEVVGTLFEDTVQRRRYPGEGSFDLDGLVQVLARTGFSGPWGVEMLSREHRTRPLEEALRVAHETTTAVLDRALAPPA